MPAVVSTWQRLMPKTLRGFLRIVSVSPIWASAVRVCPGARLFQMLIPAGVCVSTAPAKMPAVIDLRLLTRTTVPGAMFLSNAII